MPRMINHLTAADGQRAWMELRTKGLLRRAMNDTKTRTDGGPDCSSIPKLALACGLSTATVGHLVNPGEKGRKTCRVDTADRIAKAVDWPVEDLFITHRRPTRSGLANRAETAA